MKSSKYDKYIMWSFAGIVLLVPIICKTLIHQEKDKEMKNAILITGEVKRFVYTGGGTEVDVEYSYNGNIIDNSFYTYHTDSLKVKTKIRLRVSRNFPTKYIEYVGVVNE